LSQQFALAPRHSRAALLQAVETHEIATATWQTDAGWVVAKARFISADASSGVLHLELMPGQSDAQTALQIGQELGVSFRRGSRKCVFASCLVESTQDRADGRARHILRLTWPEILDELQRRLYHRTPVPPGRVVPVDLWMGPTAESTGAEGLPQRGRMVDLSAGGLSVELPREVRPRWRDDDQLSCRFSVGADQQPIEVAARLTNYTRLSDGHVRLGLQFLGLDAGGGGRHTLQQISHFAGRLRRFDPNR
jgi:c-di-GMP-binding flagellar brake protein YcgR